MAMSKTGNGCRVTPELLSRLTLRRQILGEDDQAICTELGLDPIEFEVLVRRHEIHRKSGPAFTPLGKLWREIQWRIESVGSERKQMALLEALNDHLKSRQRSSTKST